MPNSLLERALAAEERADALVERVSLLERRLRAALNAEPTSATRALSWVGRAENAEALLRELDRFIGQRAIDVTEFPAGWVARVTAQLKLLELLRRDDEKVFERPPDEEWWERYDVEGSRGITIEDKPS
jgi:hypothetical protein